MAVSHGALCLSLVLCVCGVGCGAADPNLTAGGTEERQRDTLRPPLVPEDKPSPANSNFSDHENFYNPEHYGYYSSGDLFPGTLDVPPHAVEGWEDEELPEDGTRHEGEYDTLTALSRDKNDTVTGGRQDTVHSEENSLLANTEFMSNVSSQFSYATVQSVSHAGSAETSSGPGHDAGQASRNSAPRLNSDHNRTHEGVVTHAASEHSSVSLSSVAVGVSGFLDHSRNETRILDAETQPDPLLLGVSPGEPIQPLCVVTMLPRTISVPPQDDLSGERRTTSTPPPAGDPRGVGHEVFEAWDREGQGPFSPRYLVTCNASVTLYNLSAVADIASKRRTVTL